MLPMVKQRTGILVGANNMKSPLGRLDTDIKPHYQHLLADVIRREKPNIVVETGTLYGFGSEFILKALDDNGKGRLYSIDPMDPTHHSNGCIGDPEPYDANPIVHPRFTLIRKYSDVALPALFKEVGQFDLFVHDSDHSYDVQTMEYELAWDMVRSGGIIASDDVYWGIPQHHAWEQFLKRHERFGNAVVIGNAQWIRR